MITVSMVHRPDLHHLGDDVWSMEAIANCHGIQMLCAQTIVYSKRHADAMVPFLNSIGEKELFRWEVENVPWAQEPST